MNDAETAMLPEPTSDEKTMATLAQVLQLVGWWIAPLIIYLIRRESKFVSFHAMQALLWQIVLSAVWIVTMGMYFAVIFATILHHGGKQSASNTLPVGMFIGMGFMWLVMVTVGMLNLFLGIFYGIKAGNGKWAEYPVIGKLARRIVGV